MMTVELCKYTGWDYYTLMNQPNFLLETIKIRMIDEMLASNNK